VERASWSDERLVRECLRGSEEAWTALIEKYQNLIFSIPLKFGLGKEDAADIFQSVCVDLLRDLPSLRRPKALAGWLIRVTVHRCVRWRDRLAPATLEAGVELEETAEPGAVPSALIEELEREQALREALRELSPRCRRLMHELFFMQPPRTYQEIAADLGLATGSIGFIRGRCLEKLRRKLEERGFP
jgi:RNA polymerase sigma factor (sigma-70 family)